MGDKKWLEKWADWVIRNEQRKLDGKPGSLDWLGLLLAIILIDLGGAIFIGWAIWQQIRLEKGFHDRYGNNWRVEYERYYGPLAHSHMKLAVCVMSLLGILAILGWFFYRQRRPDRRRHSHRR